MVPGRSRLRKTPVLFLILVFFYLIHRYFFSSGAENSSQPEVAQLDSRPQVEVSLCRNIVDQQPFGEDSIFSSYRNRVYFYSRQEKLQPAKHVWFRGGDTVQVVDCQPSEMVCISWVTPEKLKSGLWSVDFVSLSKLLGMRQFRVIDSAQARLNRSLP